MGFDFTWRQKGVATNIDKILVNTTFLHKFVYMKALALSTVLSNHNPLLFHTIHIQKEKGYPFRYDNTWHTQEGYYDSVCKGLQATMWGSPSYVLCFPELTTTMQRTTKKLEHN